MSGAGWMAALAGVLWSASLAAAPTQEEVLRSIQQNVSQSTANGKILACFFAGVGVLALLVWLSQRQRQQALPRSLNHPGKLLREMRRVGAIRRGQLRRLRQLAEESGHGDPLLLALCPSLGKAGVRGQGPGASGRAEP